MLFKDLFAKFIDTNDISLAFDNAEISEIVYHKNEKKLVINVRLNRLIERHILYTLEEKIISGSEKIFQSSKKLFQSNRR